MKKSTRIHLTYLVVAVMGVLLLQRAYERSQLAAPMAYSEFQTQLESGKVKEVVIGTNEIRGELSEPFEGRNRFVTNRVDTDLAAMLNEHDVKYSGEVSNSVLPMILSWLVPMALFIAVWVFLIRRMARSGGGLMSIGKSKAKVYVETDTGVSFSDVAGVEEAKHELQEIVAFLKDPATHGRLGARMPKGVLLVGPPGTGKTLLAKAIAGEAGVPFFSINGSEFVEMFVGVGAARVRDLFEQARAKSPAIIFIDELDALGKARNTQPGMGSHDEKEQTLNQLLVELDGFDPRSGIVLIAATNRPEILDPALLRAGRFDRQVLVDRPDKAGRLAILNVHVATVKTDPDLDLEQVAALTPGFTGADLENLVNEAALAATRRGAERVRLGDFEVAIERLVAGLERRNRLINPRERAIVAHHEMGHALVAAATPGADPVQKVSIIPRGVGALGYTIQRPTEDRYLMTREELEARMTVLLGGRAAERVVYGHLSTGAADDLAKATDIARSMVTRYGMVPELGHVAFDTSEPAFLGKAGMIRQPLYGPQTAGRIDEAIEQLVQQAHDRAIRLLEANRGLLEQSARELLDSETLDGPELKAYLDAAQRSAPRPSGNELAA